MKVLQNENKNKLPIQSHKALNLHQDLSVKIENYYLHKENQQKIAKFCDYFTRYFHPDMCSMCIQNTYMYNL